MSGKYVTAFTDGVNKSGFTNTGKIAIDTNPGSGDYSIANFVGGVLETYDTSGYVIITDTTTSGVDTRSTGNHTGTASVNTPTFWVSTTKDDIGFLYLVNRLPERKGLTPFTSGISAKIWLNNNGYWTSYGEFSSSITIATNDGGGLNGWNSNALAVAYSPTLISEFPVGSTIVWQDNSTAIIVQYDPYPPHYIDIFWDTPKSGTLFPIVIGII